MGQRERAPGPLPQELMDQEGQTPLLVLGTRSRQSPGSPSGAVLLSDPGGQRGLPGAGEVSLSEVKPRLPAQFQQPGWRGGGQGRRPSVSSLRP